MFDPSPSDHRKVDRRDHVRNNEDSQRRVHHLVDGQRRALVGEGPESVSAADRVARREEREDEGQEDPSGPTHESQAEEVHRGCGLWRHAIADAAAFNPAVARQTAGTPSSGIMTELTRRAPRAPPARSALKSRAAAGAAPGPPDSAARGNWAPTSAARR